MLFREWRNLCFRETHGNGETSIDRYHAGKARVCRKTIGEQISWWLAWFKSSLKFRRVVPRMLSTSNWRLTPGRCDGSSFRQIRAAVKHRISIPSVSAFPSYMINTSYMCISFVYATRYFSQSYLHFVLTIFWAYYTPVIFIKILIEFWSSIKQIYVTKIKNIFLNIINHCTIVSRFSLKYSIFTFHYYICNFVFHSFSFFYLSYLWYERQNTKTYLFTVYFWIDFFIQSTSFLM